MNEHITLTSSVGRFLFYSDVILSHAKLVRDSVVGQILNPKDRARISSSSDATNFVREIAGSFSQTPFTFIPNTVRK